MPNLSHLDPNAIIGDPNAGVLTKSRSAEDLNKEFKKVKEAIVSGNAPAAPAPKAKTPKTVTKKVKRVVVKATMDAGPNQDHPNMPAGQSTKSVDGGKNGKKNGKKNNKAAVRVMNYMSTYLYITRFLWTIALEILTIFSDTLLFVCPCCYSCGLLCCRDSLRGVCICCLC